MKTPEERREYQRKWAADNPDKVRQYAAKTRATRSAEGRQKRAEYQVEYARKHADSIRARKKAAYDALLQTRGIPGGPYELRRERQRQRDKVRLARPEVRRKKREADAARRERDPQYYARYRARGLEARRAYHREYTRNARRTDPHARILSTLRCRVRGALIHGGARKVARTLDLIGCSIGELRARLEAKFLPGMTWDNYGYRGWHIDHIKPCASFDLTDADQQRKCFHFSNLQPLWAADNIRKSGPRRQRGCPVAA